MNEFALQKLINDAKKCGGITLKHQKLKVYSNGGKFHISKTYIDDEVLNGKYPYTMILIPEMPEYLEDEFFLQARNFETVTYKVANSLCEMTWPYFVLDASHFSATFLAPLEQLEQEVKLPKQLDVVELSKGHGAIDIQCQNYRRFYYEGLEEQPAPYQQAIISARVSYQGTEGIFPIHMAVTSPAFQLPKQHLNGFPCHLANVSFRDNHASRSCDVNVDEKHLFTMRGNTLGTRRDETVTHLYSTKNDVLHRWPIIAKQDLGTSMDPGDVQLTLGNHPLAKQLKEIGLSPRATSYEYGENSKEIHGPLERLEFS